MQTENKSFQNQIADLTEIKKNLGEAETKEMKNISKQNLTKIKAFATKNDNDLVVSFLLDSLTKFMTGDDKSTYLGQGVQYFDNADDLQ